MNAIQKKLNPAARLRQAMAACTGILMSAGSRVAPQRFAAILMNMLFSPARTASSGQASAILGNASIECSLVEGNQIVHYVWGDGEKSVLLIHGWSGNAGQMTALAQSLLAAGYRVIAIDFPGHGKSGGKRASVIHFERVIASAAKIYGPFHAVVAHSLGAAAASFALARGLDCGRAVFFSPVASYRMVWERTQRLFHISPALVGLAIRRAEQWLRISFDEIEPLRLAPHQSAELLVVHDVRDRECPIADGEELARVWPNASFHGTSNLGHIRILSDEDAVRRAVNFISGRSAADSQSTISPTLKPAAQTA